MLTSSRSAFKVRQRAEMKERLLSHSSLHMGGRDRFGLRCLPGECVLQRAVLVRKKLCAAEGGGWLAGTLFCTHFRVAFVPEDSEAPEDNAEPVLLGDHDVALASVEKVVAVGPSRTKPVTASSTLKFTPEELVLYCRDMRVFCFLFDRLTPETQAVEITHVIARTYQPLKPGSVLSFQNAALGSVETKQFLSNRRKDSEMNWFEGAAEWEKELQRTGATGWRVSSVNDRFEMATSLPRFNVVPQKVLDTELKKTFSHFNEGRIPHWCWHHPHGSDLLRMGSFQNNIYHEKDDIRNLEAVVFGVQQQCVVVELAEEMPSVPDLQLALTRLKALCLGDISTSVSVPDDKWLSTLESTRWLEQVRCCLKKAADVTGLLRSGRLTVILQEPEDRDMNGVISSLVQVMCDPHCRTMWGFQGLLQKEWVMNGHRFHSRANYYRDCDKEEAPVFLLFLDCVWQLWAQSPSSFQFTEEYLLALHDSFHLPLFSSFLFNCQRERIRRTQRLGQSYTPVNGWREEASQEPSQDMSDPPYPPVWDWTLQYSLRRCSRFTQPVGLPTAASPSLNGNLNKHPQHLRMNGGSPGTVFLLSRVGFSSPPHLLPWRTGSTGTTGSGSYRKSHRRAPSSESLPGLERLLKACTSAEHGPLGFPHGEGDRRETLLPLLLGPCVQLWRGCYLRGALQEQAYSHPPHTHPVEQLAQEVQRLRDRLDTTPSLRPPTTPRKAATRQHSANLNHNSNKATFLFHRPQAMPAPPSPAPPPPDPCHGTKRTFLFSLPAEARYTPTPTARLAKNNGPS